MLFETLRNLYIFNKIYFRSICHRKYNLHFIVNTVRRSFILWLYLTCLSYPSLCTTKSLTNLTNAFFTHFLHMNFAEIFKVSFRNFLRCSSTKNLKFQFVLLFNPLSASSVLVCPLIYIISYIKMLSIPRISIYYCGIITFCLRKWMFKKRVLAHDCHRWPEKGCIYIKSIS